MKNYLSVGIVIAASLALTNLAVAHGGGGHFGGGGMHFSAPAAHFSVPMVTGRSMFSGGRDVVPGPRHGFAAADHHHHFGSRATFWGGYWPDYSDSYDGDADYGDYSTPDSDSTVVAVQKALARSGYYHGPIDGTLDLITQDAIAQYDRDHRLPVSYTINQRLLNSLRLG